jgi:hypothetical protein
MDQNVNEKIESLRSKTREFMQHEKTTLNQYGGTMLKEVEGLVIDAVESASTKIDSILVRVSDSIRKEPFVAMAAFAITGLAVFNLVNKRRKGQSSTSASASASAATGSMTDAAPDIKH